MGNRAHVALSDTNKCSDENNSGVYILCYVHIPTGLSDVSLVEDETFYHTIIEINECNLGMIERKNRRIKEQVNKSYMTSRIRL